MPNQNTKKNKKNMLINKIIKKLKAKKASADCFPAFLLTQKIFASAFIFCIIILCDILKNMQKIIKNFDF